MKPVPELKRGDLVRWSSQSRGTDRHHVGERERLRPHTGRNTCIWGEFRPEIPTNGYLVIAVQR